MDPQLTRDNKPYGPVRYKELVTERYIISKVSHTSYIDAGQLTPREREYITKYITDEIKKNEDAQNRLLTKNRE